MTDITEHHSDEETKGYNVEGSGIDLRVRWYSVGIDNSLRNLQHCIAVKFARRHLLALFNVENQRRDMHLRLDYQWQLFGWDE